MKLLLLASPMVALCLGFGAPAYGQGTIVFNNLGPDDGKVFFYNWIPGDPDPTPALLNQDLNFSLHVGRPGGYELVRTWLLGDGTANGINVGPGLFSDPSQSVIVLPGVEPGASAILRVSAWAGNHSTVLAAATAGMPAGTGYDFAVVTGSISSPPASLTGMPEFTVGVVPEPRTISLAVMGLGLFLLGRFRKASESVGA